MREIPLTQGKIALVDDDDYKELSKYKWCAVTNRGLWYAWGNRRVGGKWKTTQMHRIIMDAPTGVDVDHIDGDGLNNRRENLRFCTMAENQRNRGKQRNNTSGYKGVYWRKDRRKWGAQIRVNKRHIQCGAWPTAKGAAHAYDIAARHYYGEFARLNFPEGT